MRRRSLFYSSVSVVVHVSNDKINKKKKKMNKIPVIVFVVSLAISGISCSKDTNLCSAIDEVCVNNDDCCTQICSFSYTTFKSVCTGNPSLFDKISSFFTTKNQTGMCSYHKSKDEASNSKLYETYGLSASHVILPQYTKVQVAFKNKKILLTVNDQSPKQNGTILELSNEAARILEIDEGLFPCTVTVPVIENNPVLSFVKSYSPYLCIMFLVRLVLF